MATNNAINTGMPIGVPNGGTGADTLTSHGVLLGEGTSPITALAVAATGSVLMGSTGANPAFTGSPSFSGSVTAGTGLTITTGNAIITAGNITLPATNTARTQGVVTLNGNNFIQGLGNNNTFIGENAGNVVTSASQSTGIGALALLELTSGSNNSALGYAALSLSGTAFGNTVFGYECLANATGAVEFNTVLGYNSGTNYDTTESNNILICNTGNTGESNVIRIGTSGSGANQQNVCFIAGIDGVNVGSTATIVTMASTGQMGSAVITAGTGITVTPGSNTITINSTVSQGIVTLDATTGSATGSTVTIQGSNSNIVTSASSSTLNVALASSPSVSGSVTAGTGFTATTGNVVVTSGNITLPFTNTGRTIGVITSGGDNLIQSSADSVFIGNGSGSSATFTAGNNNTSVGVRSSGSLTSGTATSAFGYQSLNNNTVGVGNSAFGFDALEALSGSGSSYNTAVGYECLNAVASAGASYNTAIGYLSGTNYTTTESSNALFCNRGLATESNVMRLGTTGTGNAQQSVCYLAATTGVNVGSVAKVITMSTSTEQIGTATITGGTGITITPSANTITIAGTVSQGIVTLDADTGSATGTTVDIAGGSNMNTSATSATVTINLDNSPSVSGSLTAGTGITATTGAITATSGNVVVTAGNITLPYTNGARTQGAIVINGTGFLYSSADTIFIGGGAVTASTITSLNTTSVGIGASHFFTTGTDQCAFGYESLYNNVVGIGNSAFGYQSLNGQDSVGGSYSTAIGYKSLYLVSSGAYNSAFGYNSGSNYNASETSNALFCSLGVTGENNVMRLGTTGTGNAQQSVCYLAATTGVNVGSVAKVITMSTSTEQIGTATITAGTGITITPSANTIEVVNSGVVTLDGSSGSATGNTITIAGSNSNIVTSATSSTVTIALANSPSVSGSVTAGTGLTATTGNVTISGGNLSLPVSTGGSVGIITYSGNPIFSAYGSNNIFVGVGCGNFSLTVANAVDNTAIGGTNTLSSLTTGSVNTAIGSIAGFAITSGNENTLIGQQAGQSFTTGMSNVALGFNAGSGWVTSNSSNINIANIGTNESNTIRIGTQGTGNGEQNICYIAGITGTTITGSAVLCNSSGQLGDVSSSIRFKENITDIGDTTDKLMKLRPVIFNYKNDPDKNKSYGLIAEELEKVIPELVLYDKDKQPYSIKYHEFPALLLNEIQRLHRRIDELEKRV